MTRSWAVRGCFLGEVALKVAKPGRKEEKVPKGRGISRYRAIEARELHNFRTGNGPLRLESIL